MRVFVTEQIASRDTRTPVCEIVRPLAVLARLMMLKPDPTDFLAQQQQKIVVVVMVRLIELVCLRHELFVLLQLVRGDLEIFLLVSKEVEKNFVRGSRRKIESLVMNSGVQRGIAERVERRLLELDRGTLLRIGLQRRCVFPALRLFLARHPFRCDAETA